MNTFFEASLIPLLSSSLMNASRTFRGYEHGPIIIRSINSLGLTPKNFFSMLSSKINLYTICGDPYIVSTEVSKIPSAFHNLGMYIILHSFSS